MIKRETVENFVENYDLLIEDVHYGKHCGIRVLDKNTKPLFLMTFTVDKKTGKVKKNTLFNYKNLKYYKNIVATQRIRDMFKLLSK